jgi:pimeloyl-ACP methyl ester carboxylesterase
VTANSSTAIVLIHGMGGGLSNWRPVQESIVGITTIAIELPNHGESRPSRNCDTVEDVVSLVETTLSNAWSGPVVLAGHSLGGFLALSLARRMPGRVAGIALVSGHLFALSDLAGGRLDNSGRRRLAVALWRARVSASIRVGPFLRLLLNRSSLARRVLLPPFLNPALLTNASGLGDSLADHTGRGARWIYRLAKTVRPDQRASACDAPVTVIAGGRDPLVLVPDDIGRARRLLTVAEYVVLEDCAHWAPLERPLDVTTALMRIAGDDRSWSGVRGDP